MADIVEFWTPETLKAYAEETKDIPVCGKLFRIKKLPASVIGNVSKSDDSNMALVAKGLVEPALTASQIEDLPLDIVKGLMEEITKFSGIGIDEAEKN